MRGAGIFIYDCQAVLSNNTVVQNRCTSSSGIGGGIYGNTGATYSGVNNIAYFNEAAYMPQVAGPAELNYSCSSQSLTGTGNITDDPLFVDLTNHDYNLVADSPCIDAGDPTSALDPDSTRADMGALYFHQYLGLTADSKPAIPVEVVFHPAYPNPFNPNTTLQFTLTRDAFVTLSICNVKGQLIGSIVDGYLTKGAHEITFDASNLPSGVYFAQLTTSDFQQTLKLLLLK